jgi:bacterioferritin-associated ferredoxin
VYVCLCNGYRESELRDVARKDGAITAEDAYLCLGDGPCCGRCLPTAQEILDHEHRSLRAERDDRGGEGGFEELVGGLPALCPA